MAGRSPKPPIAFATPPLALRLRQDLNWRLEDRAPEGNRLFLPPSPQCLLLTMGAAVSSKGRLASGVHPSPAQVSAATRQAIV